MSTIYSVATPTLSEAHGVLVQALVNVFPVGVNVNPVGLILGPSLLAVTHGRVSKNPQGLTVAPALILLVAASAAAP